MESATLSRIGDTFSPGSDHTLFSTASISFKIKLWFVTHMHSDMAKNIREVLLVLIKTIMDAVFADQKEFLSSQSASHAGSKLISPNYMETAYFG